MTYHDNARHALSLAVARAPACVGYAQGRGWTVYDPRKGAPVGVEPELFVFAQGRLPWPLSETGAEVLASIIHSAVTRTK